MDRRGFISMSVLGAGAAMVLPSFMASPAQAVVSEPDSPEVRVAAGGGVTYHTPYGIESDCVLSQDHFLVRTGAIDPAKDTVIAYSRADGQVEAMLLQNGTVSQVYRDPAVLGGWNIRVVAAGATDMVAGMSTMDTYDATLHVFYRTAAGKVTHLEEEQPGTDGLSTGKFTVVDSFDWGPAVPGRLQITSDVAQNLLVFCLAPSSAPGRQDAKLGFYSEASGYANAGVLSGFEFNGDHGVRGGSAVVNYAFLNFDFHATLLLYVPSPHRTSVDVYQYRLQVAENTSITANVTPFANQPADFQPADFGSATVESVDYLSSPGGLYLPIAVVRSSDQELYVLSKETGSQPAWHLRQLVLPPRDSTLRQPGALRWEPSNLALNPPRTQLQRTNNLLNLFMVIGGTLSVVRQVQQQAPVQDAVTPVFNPAVPLQGGVTAAASQILPSAGDELMVVGDDGNLQVLTKTGAGGWVASKIHLPASEPAEVTTYRVQLTLTDDWSARVAGQALQVTAATPVTALIGGKGVVLSDQPVTVTTDSRGQVMIPVLAEGLAAPALNVTGAGLPSPVTIWPSEPINRYLTGADTLNYLPVFGADALASATTGAGAPLYPLAKQDKDIAAAAATVLTGAAKAGASPTTFTISAAGTGHGGGRRPVRLGTPPVHANAPVTAYGITLSFGDLAHDAIYAIKTGAAKVKAIVVSWDATVNKWVSQVTADFEAWASQEVKVVIGGLEDAASVFHSVINHLGAALDDVIDWLKAHVLKLLADTVTLAARYDGWLLHLCDELSLLIKDAKKGTGSFFTSQQSAVHAELGKIKAQLGGAPIHSLAQSSQVTGVRAADATPVPSPPASAQSNWLLQKLTQDGPTVSHVPPPASDFQTLVQDVRTKLAAEGRDFTSAAANFTDAVRHFVANPKNFGAVGIGSLLDAFGSIVDAALTLADLLTDVVLDLLAVVVDAFRALIGTSLGDLPLIGPLLKAAGMSAAPTIGSLGTLLIAFPTALGYKLAHHDGDALPFKGMSTSSVHAQDAADDLRYATAMATDYWAIMDSISAMQMAGGTTPSEFFVWVDMVTPMVISALTFPAHDGGLPFTSAIKLSDSGDDAVALAWAAGTLPGLFTAVSYYAAKTYSQPVADAIANNMLNLISCGGTAGAALGLLAAFTTTDTLHDAISPALVAVLGNVGAVMAVGLDSEAVQSSDGLSAIAVAVIGLICGTAAADILSIG
jgi:hypothetical protein